MTNREIYLDYAATTKVDERVEKEMLPYFSKIFANPAALHTPGLEAKKSIEDARERIAEVIKAEPNEIIFTSGGTESINLAIKGVAFARGKGHIITCKIEHPAVLETCRFLEKNGFSVTYLDVDEDGLVDEEDVEKAIQEDTILVSIMYANNEIGTIQPVGKIGEVARKHNVPFHSDACQAAGALDLDVIKLNADLMTLNASKIYGPKGVGILYKKSSLKIAPLLHGGGQEAAMRSGTENVPGIIGLAKALEIAEEERDRGSRRLTKLRDYFIKKIMEKVPKTFLNGHPTKRLPNNANISFLDVEGESILLYLNEKRIYVSTGSACSSQKLEVSHVLDAIRLKHDAAHGSIRFSLGKNTNKNELDYVVVVLVEWLNH